MLESEQLKCPWIIQVVVFYLFFFFSNKSEGSISVPVIIVIWLLFIIALLHCMSLTYSQ